MKLIWYSTAPHAGVGYGVITKNIVQRMQKDGHEVDIFTKHHWSGTILIDGMKVMEGCELGLVNKIFQDDGYDYIISSMDNWVLDNREKFNKWVALTFVDSEFIHPKLLNATKTALVPVAVTKHGKEALEYAGVKPQYAPVGVDTHFFRPDDEIRKEYRRKKGWPDDHIVFGLVGINYITDRKNIINTIRGFQKFHNENPKSILYLHTDVMGSATQGLPLQWVMKSCGFDDSGKGAVRFVNQRDYHQFSISHEELVGLYNGIDVMCLPSKGEGFGMPWVEAQSCGCPIISADTTSGGELNFGGYLIPKNEDDFEFSTMLTWSLRANPSEIFDAMTEALRDWTSGEITERKRKAREGALEYDWDLIYDKYWRPLLSYLEDKKYELVYESIPNYKSLLGDESGVSGRILFCDCGYKCETKPCAQMDWPLFYGEEKTERPLMSRLWPILANRNGELLIDPKCPFYEYVTPSFKSEAKRVWEHLMSYPKVRKAYAKMIEQGEISLEEFVPVSSLSPKFDSTYKKLIQDFVHTTFKIDDRILKLIPSGGKVVDVGAGLGERVRALRELGFKAEGFDINSSTCDGDVVKYGSVMSVPVEDSYADLVLCVDVLEHVDDPMKGLLELLRITKKYVALAITPVDDISYSMDPTHCVEWNKERWKREVSEYAEIEYTDDRGVFILRRID